MHRERIKFTKTFHTFLITLVLHSTNPQQNEIQRGDGTKYSNVKKNSTSLRNETMKQLQTSKKQSLPCRSFQGKRQGKP